MSQISHIKSRIQSINSIAKITKAMQLVSTAKLKKISKNLWSIKTYSSEVYDVFNSIIKNTTESKYLALDNFVAKKTLWIVINSNLGLCGGYNININKLVLKNMKANDDILAFGSKAKSYFFNNKKNIIEAIDININLTSEDCKKYVFEIHDKFIDKKYDSIKITYTSFINSINYEPKILDLLPIVKIKSNDETNKLSAICEFDPNVDEILEKSIILYLNTILYSALMESQVSEHTARRIAMESATENADKLKDKLTLEYNRRRQDGITQEISEIISGSNAQN